MKMSDHKYEHIVSAQIPQVIEEVNSRRKIAQQMRDQIEAQFAEAIQKCEEALKECDDDITFLENRQTKD
tara:strand:- start:40 stop:249 length:210 start_codon:yes stop_codon:yes gene_type:complete